MLNADAIQSKFKAGLPMIEWDSAMNKASWTFFKGFASELKQAEKQAVNEAVKAQAEVFKAEKEAAKKSTAKYTDEEAKDNFLNHLKQKAADGDFDAALAGKIMDAFNIKAKDRDITMSIIDFKDAYPEDADVIKLTSALIDSMIVEANNEHG